MMFGTRSSVPNPSGTRREDIDTDRYYSGKACEQKFFCWFVISLVQILIVIKSSYLYCNHNVVTMNTMFTLIFPIRDRQSIDINLNQQVCTYIPPLLPTADGASFRV